MLQVWAACCFEMLLCLMRALIGVQPVSLCQPLLLAQNRQHVADPDILLGCILPTCCCHA